jgi:hypothetical protein
MWDLYTCLFPKAVAEQAEYLTSVAVRPARKSTEKSCPTDNSIKQLFSIIDKQVTVQPV